MPCIEKTNLNQIYLSLTRLLILQEYKTGGQEKKCCWACVLCKENAYTVEDQSECRPCPKGYWPNENKTGN